MNDLGVTPCTDPNCRSHGELVRLRNQIHDLREWCAYQDLLSKGESPTTKAIYGFIGREDA
jgi:hypothetical protein